MDRLIEWLPRNIIADGAARSSTATSVSTT
jgi:hypothetical protein